MLIDSISNKRKILAHFLDLCVSDGWNDETLKAAVIKAEIDVKFTNLIFENGVNDIADFFIAENNAKMIEQIKELNLNNMRIRDKIKSAVKIRLMIDEPNKLAIKRLINFYLHLGKNVYAIKNCYKTADLIWYQIGDNSTDFNFYTKRIMLAKVYIRTLLYFLNDNSENNFKTLKFLDDQIEKIMQFEKLKSKVKNYFNKAEKTSQKIFHLKQNFSKTSAKNLIKKLPFFRLYNK